MPPFAARDREQNSIRNQDLLKLQIPAVGRRQPHRVVSAEFEYLTLSTLP